MSDNNLSDGFLCPFNKDLDEDCNLFAITVSPNLHNYETAITGDKNILLSANPQTSGSNRSCFKQLFPLLFDSNSDDTNNQSNYENPPIDSEPEVEVEVEVLTSDRSESHTNSDKRLNVERDGKQCISNELYSASTSTDNLRSESRNDSDESNYEPKRKRGRPSKNRSPDQQIEVIRETNKKSANKYREKKKRNIECLQQKNEELLKENRNLKQICETKEKEIKVCKIIIKQVLNLNEETAEQMLKKLANNRNTTLLFIPKE